MKKIFMSFIVLVFLIPSVFAINDTAESKYTPNYYDTQLIEKITRIVDKMDWEKRSKLNSKIGKILKKLDKNSRAYFILNKIETFIFDKVDYSFTNSYNFISLLQLQKVQCGDTTLRITAGSSVGEDILEKRKITILNGQTLVDTIEGHDLRGDVFYTCNLGTPFIHVDGGETSVKYLAQYEITGKEIEKTVCRTGYELGQEKSEVSYRDLSINNKLIKKTGGETIKECESTLNFIRDIRSRGYTTDV